MKTKLYYSFWILTAVAASAGLVAIRHDTIPTAVPQSTPPTATVTPTSMQTPSLRVATPQSTESDSKKASLSVVLEQASARAESGINKVGGSLITKNGTTYPLRVYAPAIIPNDTYANQWWVSQASMTNVWDLPAGSRATKVAIIDTGFALSHQDLTNRWTTNNGESGTTSQQAASSLNCTARSLSLDKSCNQIDDNFDGIIDNESGVTTKQNPSRLNCTDQGRALDKSCNRLDDDINGYIDDYRGWDFSNFDNSVQAGEVNPGGTGTTHGTMVAGVFGATGNNSVGVAGVNWYSSILPIQALDDDSYGDSLTVSEGIHYATDQGVDVISISLATSQVDPFIREAVRYATDHGVLVVAASGNDGCNCISYPANYPEVIAVGAIDQTGNPASFSNYGPNLDVLAPGQNMISSYWTSSNGTSSYAGGIAGTSFATPFVSGLLALGRSYQPTATWDEIVGAMLENTDKRSLSVASPRSDQLGLGVVKADTMLNRLRTVQSLAVRYQFGSNLIQGSKNIYQCSSGVPSTPLYRLNKPNQQSYAVGTLGYYNVTASGWTITPFAYSCIGLPTDSPLTIRSIDLNREAFNLNIKP